MEYLLFGITGEPITALLVGIFASATIITIFSKKWESS